MAILTVGFTAYMTLGVYGAVIEIEGQRAQGKWLSGLAAIIFLVTKQVAGWIDGGRAGR